MNISHCLPRKNVIFIHNRYKWSCKLLISNIIDVVFYLFTYSSANVIKRHFVRVWCNFLSLIIQYMEHIDALLIIKVTILVLYNLSTKSYSVYKSCMNLCIIINWYQYIFSQCYKLTSKSCLHLYIKFSTILVHLCYLVFSSGCLSYYGMIMSEQILKFLNCSKNFFFSYVS